MSKYKSFFFQVSRSPFQPENNNFAGESGARINDLSLPAFKLYIWLHELEQRYTGDYPGETVPKGKKKKQDFFFHSDANLVDLTGMSHGSIQKAKKELVSEGLIQTWQMHWIDSETKRKSFKHVTAYRIKTF